ncbi:MAG: hypothetical protein GQE15_13835 [Archangiaceae bacterium]|nr:hypothetical protein [Archangiaceae bacterium]
MPAPQQPEPPRRVGTNTWTEVETVGANSPTSMKTLPSSDPGLKTGEGS